MADVLPVADRMWQALGPSGRWSQAFHRATIGHLPAVPRCGVANPGFPFMRTRNLKPKQS